MYCLKENCVQWMHLIRRLTRSLGSVCEKEKRLTQRLIDAGVTRAHLCPYRKVYVYVTLQIDFPPIPTFYMQS